MRRVYLVRPGERLLNDDGFVAVDRGLLRQAAKALALFATNRSVGRSIGDPVHEWITEGRRSEYERALKQGAAWARNMSAGYSSCGDLPHWLLMCLGCRDERYVNRTDDGGDVPWKSGVNISRLCSLPSYRNPNEYDPLPGDIIHVASPDHVAVTIRASYMTREIESADYGQPYAAMKLHTLLRRSETQILVGARTLRGVVDISAVRFAESAIVPNDFEGGTPDENPYADAVVIPSNVP